MWKDSFTQAVFGKPLGKSDKASPFVVGLSAFMVPFVLFMIPISQFVPLLFAVAIGEDGRNPYSDDTSFTATMRTISAIFACVSLFCTAIACPFAGSVADMFGRKKVMFYGILAYLFFSFMQTLICWLEPGYGPMSVRFTSISIVLCLMVALLTAFNYYYESVIGMDSTPFQDMIASVVPSIFNLIEAVLWTMLFVRSHYFRSPLKAKNQGPDMSEAWLSDTQTEGGGGERKGRGWDGV
ncbi:hypothetical protein KIPB_003130 [Kipferlia bialata]|uniref:Uncharacterized protein n=1 Tax=Kipferlia bialata TaxID=797122 RepID=A0A9K3CSX3_9EUKA|nr:hypothetical protein KIPB_003130 [Kipferlia bialata]|eukprot:g3130.t1